MALEDDIATLSRAPVFRLLDSDALRLLAFAGEHRSLRRDDVLFRKGDQSDGGFVVTRGRLSLAPEAGVEAFIAEPAALIGQAALFARTEWAATATAREASTVLRMSRVLMRRVLQEFPAGADEIREALSAELLALSSSLERVGALLLAQESQRTERLPR